MSLGISLYYFIFDIIFVLGGKLTMNLSNLQHLKKSRLIHLCMAITFFTSGVIVNLIQCILYLTLRPFNKVLYRKINWYLCCTIYARKYFFDSSNFECKCLVYILINLTL